MFYLFPNKDTLVVEIRKLFICSVDAQLLKTINFKFLKSKDIQ